MLMAGMKFFTRSISRAKSLVDERAVGEGEELAVAGASSQSFMMSAFLRTSGSPPEKRYI